jgi:hypothetical protein
MKTLQFDREKKANDVMVECADGWLSVYRKCAYCIHCSGVRLVNKRIMENPIKKRLQEVKRGFAADDDLLNAGIMFNTLIRDGDAIECDDDRNEGYYPLYRL